MADEKTVRQSDRIALAAEHNDVVRYLTEKYGFKSKWVRNLIAYHGYDRQKLEQAARELKGA